MNILAGLTVKGLGYAVLALGIALALTVTGWTLHAKSLNAQLDAAKVDTGRVEAARDAALASNQSYVDLANAETAKLVSCHLLLKTEEIDGQLAVAKATAFAQRADADLAGFKRIFDNVTGVCSTALANMQHACESEIGEY